MTAATGISAELEAARRAYEADVAEAEQASLFDPPTAEEMLEAREELGSEAGALTLLRHARERRKRGRPPGAKNRATQDFVNYLSQFGPNPLVGAYRLANTPPEVLIEASAQEVVHSFSKNNEPRLVIQKMTYEAALAAIARARELIAPYLLGKKPVAIDLTVRGDITLIEEVGTGGSGGAIDGEFLEVGPSPEAAP